MSEVEAHAMYLLDMGMEVLDVAKELMKLGIKDLNRAGVDLAALDEKVRESKRQKSLVDINSSEKSTSKKGGRAADTIVIPDSPPAEQASLKIQRIGYQETALGITAQPQPASKEKEKAKETVITVRRNDDADELRDKFPLPPSEKIKFILQRVKQQFPQDFRRMKNYMVMFDVPKHVARKERERSKQFHQGLIRLTGPKEMPTGPPNEHAVKGLWTSRTKGFLNIEQEKKVRELLRAGHKLDSDEVREVSTMEEQDHIEIFIDNSNIYLSFLKYIKFAERAAGRSVFSDQARAQGEFMGRRPKLDYAMLFSILERGRKARAKYIVGSSPLPQSLEVAVEWGYEVSLLQRVRQAVNLPDDDILDPSRRRRGVKRLRTRQTSGGVRYTEQGVDEILRMKLLESLAVERSPNAKVTIVLVSGDGAASDFSDEGFMTPIRAALKKGWNVEIVAFGMCTSAAWFDKKVTKLGTGTLNIIEMEDWAEALIS
ncbi:hypothetical protein BT69DRAFT_534610 [Atractiella rhizophila]|nr:hypothetical protein BT69DRAFT_534610 [Atractiella rhizophila]